MPDANFVSMLVQFTLSGASLTFVWNSLRDEEARRQSALASLRDLAGEVDDHYRSAKQIKRMIRSRQTGTTPPFELNAIFLERHMDALSNIQLKIEAVRNKVRSLPDIIGESRQERIVKYLEYSADYFGTVVGDFERRRVVSQKDVYEIGSTCMGLLDFLGVRRKVKSTSPTDLRDAWGEFMAEKVEFDGQTPIGEDAALFSESYSQKSYSEQFDAFKRLTKRDDFNPLPRLTKSISDECMLQAMRELRDEITTSRGLLSLRWLSRRSGLWPART